MLKKEDIYLILLLTIKNKTEHRDYKHVCELAKLYRALISGEGLDEYLKQFNLREDDISFKQRVRLTNLITSCITGTLITPEKKVPAVKPVTKGYEYSTGNKKRKDELTKAIDQFYGGQGIENYLNDAFMNLWDSDPNAFILYLFNDFDNKIEKPVPYAIEIPSEEAVDYSYIDNKLQYLTVRKCIQYERIQPEPAEALKKKKGADKKDYVEQTGDGYYYTIYSGNDQISFRQIDANTILTTIEEGILFTVTESAAIPIEIKNTKPKIIYYYKFDKNTLYEVKFFEPKAKQVPALRVGSIPDICTDRRTCVNGWHRAVPYLMKSISAVSELDISVKLHVYPQKFEYQPRCPGTFKDKKNYPCNQGALPDGRTCPECKGSGFTTHTSSQDTIRMAMPKDPNSAFDLSKLVFYAALPIEVVKWLDEYVDKIEMKAIKAVFNTDVFQKTVFAQTATEKIIDLQSVYDSLSPLAQRYSYAWTFSIKQISVYSSLDNGLVVKHIFPKNFRFESVEVRMQQIKTARDAGIDDYTLAYMNWEVTTMVFEDQPELLQQIQVKNSFFPFKGKSETTIMSLITNNLVTKYNEVLYSEFETIFTEIEAEVRAKNPEDPNSDIEPVSFYSLTREMQKQLIDAKVKAIITTLETENPPMVNTSSFFAPGAPGPNVN